MGSRDGISFPDAFYAHYSVTSAMNVTLFRDIKEENWPSMELYADRLAEQIQANFGGEATGRPVSVGPLIPGVKGRFLTASIYAARALKYPLIARLKQGDLNHIVDHSYAHLAHFLDR